MAIDVIRYVAGPSLVGPGPALIVDAAERRSDRDVARALARVPGARRASGTGGAIAAIADALAHAVGANTGRSRVGGAAVHLRCPNRVVGHALLDAALAILDGVAVEHALATVLVAWERPAEAALLARAARRVGLPALWVPPDERWLFLGQGRRGRAYHHGYLGGARDVADDKLATARRLEAAGLPTAGSCAAGDEAAAVAVARRIGFPVVVKPSRAWAQVGVWTELRTPADVRRAYRRAREQAGVLAGPIVVERQVAGHYVRATLIDGALAAALITGAAPAVIGDGRHTIRELAGDLDPRLAGIVEAVTAAQARTLRSIPRRGERVRVGLASHGPTRDLTGELDRTTRAVLDRVGALFPAPALGVDLLIADPRGAFDPACDVVLEVNPAPAFSLHERPSSGRTRDLAPAVLAAAHAARVQIIAGVDCDDGIERAADAAWRRGLHPAGWSRGRSWSRSPEHVVGDGPEAAVLPILDERADVLMFSIDSELAVRGLPFDRADIALVRG